MAKRVYTKKGDVYEIKIDAASKKYMQFIGSDWHQLNSDTFRVYKKVYPIDATPSLEEILNDIPDFYVHSFASGGIKDGHSGIFMKDLMTLFYMKVRYFPKNGN